MQPHFCVQFRADFRADFEAKNAYRTKKSMQVNEKTAFNGKASKALIYK